MHIIVVHTSVFVFLSREIGKRKGERPTYVNVIEFDKFKSYVNF